MENGRVASRIGYRFSELELLRQALTHRSHSAANNERLEFLGDGVLDCAIALELYRRFPRLSEGELSRLRAHFVNQQTLCDIATELDLGSELLLGEGEVKSGGARRPSILADALEAVIGAAFLDGGFEAGHTVVRRIFGPLLDRADPQVLGKDPKTLLQEHLQAQRAALPQYQVIATRGEAHAQTFEVECVVAQLNVRTIGTGASRRSAEQEAARRAYALVARI